MSEAMPTPGPWIVVEGNKGPKNAAAWICTIGNNAGDPAVFSTVFNGPKFVFGDKLADARLIAAAPDMLAALKALAGPMEAVRDDQASLGLRFGSTPAARAERARILIDWIKANADTVDDALEVAFAAIAKAEGH